MSDRAPVRWSTSVRIAFRFAVIYFGLYITTTQMIGTLFAAPDVEIPVPGAIRSLVTWVAAHVFGVTEPLVIEGSGSGDKMFDWLQVFCLLIVTILGTAAWSVLDRRRPNYLRLQPWFWLFIRVSLGATMISYGMAKVFPLQMGPPSLARLVEPFGQFSPMGVIWSSIGASRSYEMFTGFAEVAGGVLICIPGLTMLGALICLLATTQVFALNMTYDVPVKLFSFHLIVLSLVVLAPELKRLTNVIVLNRPAGPSTQSMLGRTQRTRWIAVAAQIVIATYLIGMNVWGAQRMRREFGDLAPTTPIQGIWAIEAMTVNGESRPPQGTSADRWRRVIVNAPMLVVVQRMDDSFAYYRAQIDMEASTVTLTRGRDQTGQILKFTQPTPTTLVLDGTLDGRAAHIETSLIDHRKFPLLTRGFHWIQEYPFNR